MENQSLGRWISVLYRYGHVYVSRELEPFGIGKGQFMFLLVLYHEDGLSQDEMARRLNIDKGTTARAIGKLEEEGYVFRKTSELDRRLNHVYLSIKANDFKTQFFTILDRWTDILSEGLTQEEVRMAFDLLEKMSQNAARHVKKEGKRGNSDETTK
ncbi:DNA-binding MarR family transcriptional regulator [Bacillus mesophilus]|uniref:MarR family transcriptional regulator n=1 Tax=Bacillus mesophilus TaxID=1808955 RepID=A0A6M0QA16_9BACI|nr:MarR family transcriptional regulator [Bacillus mesophilus]MBM7662722.1 DNA-binding MarR family transcriptional regulator [Bacillus mesophilus]NEY73216.1 MarR family transcriptional regulator [Bacillus mesophilus]